MNFWSLTNLREPAESIQIGTSISTFAVSPESESILVGDEQGTMYTVAAPAQAGGGGGGQRSSRRQAKKMATVDEEGENHGHYGLITSLSAKSLKKGATTRAAGLTKGFLRGSGGLTLSAGVDWTVKLWAPAYTDRPLVSFVSHSYDYMSDVMWNPVHPTLFATASSSGSIGLWNLAHSFEEPITEQDGITIESERGLNKLKWSLDGRRLAAASSDRVHIVSLADDIVRAKGDEDSKVMNHLLSRGLIDRA
jgi:dynein intermediate chain, cytosolic